MLRHLGLAAAHEQDLHMLCWPDMKGPLPGSRSSNPPMGTSMGCLYDSPHAGARRHLCLYKYTNQITTRWLWLQGDIIGVGIRTTGEVIVFPADEDVPGRGVQHVFDEA